MAALDGLRAVAVVAVVAYHAALEEAPGGFFGVDVFFVISGYLVTSLFLGRATADGLRDTLDFWRRRLLRLVPAAVAAIAVTWLAFAALDVRTLDSLTGEAFAALGYVANWFFLLREQSYFETISQPSPFLHFWSLAVEAQFYLVWPLLLLGALKVGGRLATFALAVSLAAVSTVVVSTLYDPATDPSRAYYGTDGRVAGLLLGAAVAIIVRPGFSQRGARTAVEVAGWAGIGALVWLVTQVSEFDPFIYRGGFFMASTAAVGVVLAALHGRNSVASLLSLAPLRWLGYRSYSVYLWHWPVFVLTQPHLSADLRSPSLLLARLGATLILAELSYRLVENRFRAGADWRRMPRFTRTSAVWWREPWVRPAGIVAAGALAIVVAGGLPVRPGLASALAEDAALAAAAPATVAPTAAPAASAEEPPAAPGQPLPGPPELPASMVVRTPGPAPTVTVEPAATATAATQPTASAAPTSFATPVPSATPPLSAAPPPGATPATAPTAAPVADAPHDPGPAIAPSVTAIGDSVMLGAAPALQAALPGASLDAEVGRQFRAAVDIVAAARAAGTLGDVVVVHLGHNGVFTSGEFDALMTALDGVRPVVFVNVTVPRRWESEVNDALTRAVAGRAGVALADWHAISADQAGYFATDGVHLTAEGQAAYAALIQQAVTTARAR